MYIHAYTCIYIYIHVYWPRPWPWPWLWPWPWPWPWSTPKPSPWRGFGHDRGHGGGHGRGRGYGHGQGRGLGHGCGHAVAVAMASFHPIASWLLPKRHVAATLWDGFSGGGDGLSTVCAELRRQNCSFRLNGKSRNLARLGATCNCNLAARGLNVIFGAFRNLYHNYRTSIMRGPYGTFQTTVLRGKAQT